MLICGRAQGNPVEQANSQLTSSVFSLRNRIATITMKVQQIGKVHLGVRLELDQQQPLDSLAHKVGQRRTVNFSIASAGSQPQATHTQPADAIRPRFQDVIP